MPKIIFTPELADTLKAIRVKNKIPAKAVATAIGHSPSYISKLENYGIKSLAQEEFDKLLEVIIQDGNSIDECRDQLLTLYSVRYSKDEREEQLWFLNLDSVVRLLPIPDTLIAEVNDMLQESKTSISELVIRINKNEELNEVDAQNTALPFNEWFENSEDPEARHSIKMNLNQSDVEQILSGALPVCNYITMLAIVHYSLKFSLHDNEHHWTSEDLLENWQKTYAILDKHRFYSMSRKAMLLSKAHSKVEQDSILSEFDIKNQEIINSILKFFKMAAELNVLRANKVLNQFSKNLDWDFSFMLQLTGIKFDEIGECSFSSKNQLLKEISALVKKYCDMPEEIKKAETYEYDI